MLPVSLQQFITEHRHDDVRQLALEASRYPDVDMRSALVQISGWQKACEKLPSWASVEGIVYPEKISLEQCSSEGTANYKLDVARRLCDGNHESLVDLTGGLAVDGSILARHFNHYLYIESQKQLCEIACHNLPLLGIDDFEVRQGHCEDFISSLPHQDMIFIDPARRDDTGRKVVGLKDCTPDITLMLDDLLGKCDFLMVKLSPMIDIKAAISQLRQVIEIHVVAVDGECKEVLIVMQGYGSAENVPVCMNAVNIKINDENELFSFHPAEEQNLSCLLSDKLGKYLYEPNAAVMKAGGYKTLAHSYHTSQLDTNTHLYTSDHLIDHFPGRKFMVVGATSFSKKSLKSFLAEMTQCNLTVRNFPSTVAELRKRLNLRDGGTDYLFATTMRGERLLIKCKKA
jgi:hypothetical protein